MSRESARLRVTIDGKDVTEQVLVAPPDLSGLGHLVTEQELQEALFGHLLRRGPFISEDGDVWVPVTVGSIAQAWPIARETDWDLRFVGMDDNAQMSIHGLDEMHDREDDGECDISTPEAPCTWRARAYHFEVRDD